MLAVRRQVSIVSGDGCVLFEHFGRGRKKAGKKRDDVVEGTVVAAEGQVRLCNRVQCQSLQVLLCLSRSFSSRGCAGWLLAGVSGCRWARAQQPTRSTCARCATASTPRRSWRSSPTRALNGRWRKGVYRDHELRVCRVRCVFGCVRSPPVIVDATEAVTVDRGPQVRITQAPLSGLFQPQKDEIPLRCC